MGIGGHGGGRGLARQGISCCWKSLLVLEDGIIEGRKVFGNIIKYIPHGRWGSNFGELCSGVGNTDVAAFEPMKPIHLLQQSAVRLFAAKVIPTDKVDEEYLEKPRKWNIDNCPKIHENTSGRSVR